MSDDGKPRIAEPMTSGGNAAATCATIMSLGRVPGLDAPAALYDLFVVFRKPATAGAATVTTTVTHVEGSWTVAFQPGGGAPASIRLPALGPLHTNADPRVRHFSGVATYPADLTVPSRQAGTPVVLDFGKIRDVTEMWVNGTPVGTAWHEPCRPDVGSAVHSGRNRIEVRIANPWVNQLIGDAQPGAQKVAWTSKPGYRADAPLRASGLIGPVTLATVR